jgi:hypothetical protein
MSNIVEYILNLKDNLSTGLSGAAKKAEHLKGEMGGLGSKVLEVGAMFGVAFGAYKLGEFIHEGIDKFHELEQSTAKIEANIKATGMAAGITGEELKTMASGLSGHIKATLSEVTDMQSQLLTFPSITKDVFAQAMSQTADIAAQTGHGWSETAIMYGKALNDPIKGLQKLSRYGVILTDQEKERITKLEASGNLIEAQKSMMDAIAHSGYAGVAEAMFNADPIARYNKLMGKAQLAIGEYAMEAMKSIVPALESVARGVSSIVGFVKEHSAAIGAMVGIYATYKGMMYGLIALEKLNAYWLGIQGLQNQFLIGWYSARVAGTNMLTAAQWGLNAAMDANPIGLIVLAVAAVAVGLYEAYTQFDGFRHGVNAFGNTLMAMYHWINDYFIAPLRMAWDLLSGDVKGAKENYDEFMNANHRAATDIGKAWDGHEAKKEEANRKWLADETKTVEGIKALYDKHLLKESTYAKKSVGIIQTLNQAEKAGQITEEQKNKLLSLLPQKGNRFGKGADGLDKNPTQPKTKAEGHQNINIHIAYNQPLIKDFTISTTNVKGEGLGKLKELVTQILTDATQDSLIVAGN